MGHILIVDDEVGIRELLSEILQDEGYQVSLAENAGQAREARNQNRPDLVLLDIWMPDCDGITLLKEWARSGQLTMPVVMMSGHGTVDTAVEATRIGAVDFMEKPIALQKLLTTVSRAMLKGKSLQRHEASLASLGRAQAVEQIKKRLDQILHVKTPVLLLGEPGSAFEACARYLHTPNTPWVAPEHPEAMAENPVGALTEAKNGVVYLPDIHLLSKRAQHGLLLILSKAEKYATRVICTAPVPLAPLVAEKQFDSRVWQALSALTIAVPPLRDHAEDVPDLANQTLTRLIESKQIPVRRFTTAALNALRNYDWPGNHEELSSVVRSVALTASQDEIDLPEVEPLLRKSVESSSASLEELGLSLDQPLREARDAFERLYFEHHIRLENGNMSRVADKVGLERTHLYRKLKQLGVAVGKRG